MTNHTAIHVHLGMKLKWVNRIIQKYVHVYITRQGIIMMCFDIECKDQYCTLIPLNLLTIKTIEALLTISLISDQL